MAYRTVLVTGSRRSGTTFVGRMLALDRSVAYVHEPFNSEQGVRGLNDGLWLPYLTRSNVTPRQRRILGRLLALRSVPWKTSLGDAKTDRFKYDVGLFDLIENLWSNVSGEPVGKRFGRLLLRNRSHVFYTLARLDPRHRVVLLKDPVAALAAKYLAREHGVLVVVVVRHPAAYYYSMKKKGWGLPPRVFLEQPDLVSEHLLEHQDALRRAAQHGNRQQWAVWEWVCVHQVLADWAAVEPGVSVVRHEDICREPMETFRMLYDTLGLPFTASVQRRIGPYTAASNRAETEAAMDIRRNSAALADAWRAKLTDDELTALRQATGALADRYYGEADW